MNGIDKIVARMESDAKAEQDTLHAETAARCAEIQAEFEEKAQKEYAARIEAGVTACRMQAERLAGAADMAARKNLLQFKQNAINDVFLEAERQLAALPKEQYIQLLASLAARAAVFGEEELVFNETDAQEVGAAVAKAANTILGEKGHLTVSAETRRIPGGVIIKQGDIETNCAVDTLVQLCRNDVSAQVAEILFS